ncbi:MAG: methyltransferase domain-containing protein [Deltaproteobacteria bacterium]|nr:methyltransferase domain-containing protein [Deltaproteobacteria bacterium]
MNKEKILRILSDHPKWEQKDKLPFGQETKVGDRSQIANQIFPPDLEGASVLDIGCAEGFFCFEAKRRNAGRVVGIDIDKERLGEAIKLSRALSADIEFLECDISNVEELGTFDYVLCLDVLHLVEDPIHFIYKLIHLTGRKLILEIADLRLRRRKRVIVCGRLY